ncbi:N-myristoyl transferase [Suillus subalutaceus]|uniref:N-myristoyl transferase n=1 Tax=Suillus subalutaceus TaxID=48586 RepID=UPI001B87DAE7|nr:N-myristoyl transferase [Suillus subalutaceus]KAG1877950.1 N-myristoyl transferase [Suillus subalutaceus]
MSSSSQKAQIKEIIDTTQGSDLEDRCSTPEPEVDHEQDGAITPQASSSKPKKKKKSKAAKVLNAVRGKNEIPQELISHVVDRVAAEHGPNTPATNEDNIRQALEQMKIMDVIKGKSGIAGRGKKAMGEHKFWATQPVPQLGDDESLDDGFIEPDKSREEVRQDAYPLPKDFEWSILDINDSKQIKEVYDLLSLNYVEDDEAAFRFQYSAEFLEWALKPPGYLKDWHIGVRVSSNKKLVAFISGVPVTLRVRGNVFRACEINYLCVHKKLRSKRLAPVLIKEVTRQVNLTGVFQAIYTAGVVLPTPVSTCRYFHRSLNIPKLVDVKFTYVPRSMTLARMMRVYKLVAKPQLSGLREMEERDVSDVADLFTRYMQRFSMLPVMTLDEIRHQFLSGRGRMDEPSEHYRRPGQVVWTYVVEEANTGRITDFFSFYSLPSTIINHPKHGLLEAAYLFYYASDAAFVEDSEADNLKKRLEALIGDALIIADQAKFDVFNALTLMDNCSFLENLKFGAGDGLLNFYLYNWRTAPLAGISAVDGVEAGKGVGVVML